MIDYEMVWRSANSEIDAIAKERDTLNRQVIACTENISQLETELGERNAEVDALHSAMADLQNSEIKAELEISACANALPGPYYMDPPDGGSVTIGEQVARMAKDAMRYRQIKLCKSDRYGDVYPMMFLPCGDSPVDTDLLDDAIDEAIEVIDANITVNFFKEKL